MHLEGIDRHANSAILLLKLLDGNGHVFALLLLVT